MTASRGEARLPDNDLNDTLSMDRRVSHPVKDVVLPVAMVISLITNAGLFGVAWGKMSQRMDTSDRVQIEMQQTLRDVVHTMQAERDKVRDLQHDVSDLKTDAELLEDYTRGRVDHLPYRAPKRNNKQ